MSASSQGLAGAKWRLWPGHAEAARTGEAACGVCPRRQVQAALVPALRLLAASLHLLGQQGLQLVVQGLHRGPSCAWLRGV